MFGQKKQESKVTHKRQKDQREVWVNNELVYYCKAISSAINRVHSITGKPKKFLSQCIEHDEMTISFRFK